MAAPRISFTSSELCRRLHPNTNQISGFERSGPCEDKLYLKLDYRGSDYHKTLVSRIFLSQLHCFDEVGLGGSLAPTEERTRFAVNTITHKTKHFGVQKTGLSEVRPCTKSAQNNARQKTLKRDSRRSDLRKTAISHNFTLKRDWRHENAQTIIFIRFGRPTGMI